MCGATAVYDDVIRALRSAGMLVGDARAIKWRYEATDMDARM